MRDTTVRSASKSRWISSRLLELMFECYADPPTTIPTPTPLKPKWRKLFETLDAARSPPRSVGVAKSRAATSDPPAPLRFRAARSEVERLRGVRLPRRELPGLPQQRLRLG